MGGVDPSALLAGVTIGTIGILKQTPDEGLLILGNGPGEDGLWQAVLIVAGDKFEPLLSTLYLFATAKDAEEVMRRVVKAAREIDLIGREAGTGAQGTP